jgi:rubrerythrin
MRMSATFNADEIFEMAEQIERNGAAFYRKAAERAKDPEIRTLFTHLAIMEETHLRLFGEMRARYAQDRAANRQFDPDNEAMQYLQTLASCQGWEGKASPLREMNGTEPLEQVLWKALAAEKDAVVFYTGMKELISAADRLALDEIIREELVHVALFQKAYDKHHA